MDEVIKSRKLVGPNAGRTSEVSLTRTQLLNPDKTRARDVWTATVTKVDGKETSPYLMVLKDYSNRPWEIERVESNYKRCHDAGLKVVSTFRIDENKKQVLMTYLNRGNRVALSHNNSSSEAPRGKFITHVVHHKEFIDRLYRHALTAAKHGIFLPCDSYLFLANTNSDTSGTLDFCVGDYDLIAYREPPFSADTTKSTMRNNLHHAKLAILEFCAKYLDHSIENKKVTNAIAAAYTAIRKEFQIR